MSNVFGPAGERGHQRARDAMGDEGRRDASPVRPPRPLDRLMFDQIMSQLSALPPVAPGASRPLSLPPFRPAPNVFETPWAPGDPPMPWARSAAKGRARRRSILPWLVFAMMLGIGIGMWRDKPARARVVSQLRVTGKQAAAFVHR